MNEEPSSAFSHVLRHMEISIETFLYPRYNPVYYCFNYLTFIKRMERNQDRINLFKICIDSVFAKLDVAISRQRLKIVCDVMKQKYI